MGKSSQVRYLIRNNIVAKLIDLVITQCSMRHLYASASEPGISYLIDKAKLYERRRCDHRPEEFPEPLSAVECLSSVVDPKGSKTNKHRYVVASQQVDVRKAMRAVMGVPLVYINRSVMIMEPMAGATVQNRDREEREKFRAGLKGGRGSGSQGMKRKRDEDDNDGGRPSDLQNNESIAGEAAAKKKRTHGKGPKGPNPLSVKKSKKAADGEKAGVPTKSESIPRSEPHTEGAAGDAALETVKRKRRRKHKPGVGEGDMAGNEGVVVEAED
jgi:U3 small nucleolar RNA-associated protein 23